MRSVSIWLKISFTAVIRCAAWTNLVYYGSMADKYIIMMQVLDTEDVKDLKLAKRVSIQLQLTDPNLRSRDRVVRSTEKGSMAEAMEFATIWLERALSGKM